MNCDWTQLQGCLCRFHPYKAEPVRSEKKKKCETLLNSDDGSQPSYQQARLHSWCGHLKDLHCQQVKDSACTPSCFRFSAKRNLISLSQFIMSPCVCGEILQPVDSNKVYKDPADFKHLTAQCGFLTEPSNKGCVGKVDILCVVRVQESHSSDAEVLTQQGSKRCCYNSSRLNISEEA